MYQEINKTSAVSDSRFELSRRSRNDSTINYTKRKEVPDQPLDTHMSTTQLSHFNSVRNPAAKYVKISQKDNLKDVDGAIKKILDGLSNQNDVISRDNDQLSDVENQSIETLFQQFKKYVKDVEKENICIDESLDNHLMKKYFDKIIEMNDPDQLISMFEQLNYLSQDIDQNINLNSFTKNFGGQNEKRRQSNSCHLVQVNNLKNSKRNSLQSNNFLIQTVYDGERNHLMLRFHSISKDDLTANLMDEFIIRDQNAFIDKSSIKVKKQFRPVHDQLAQFQQRDWYVYFFQIKKDPNYMNQWHIIPKVYNLLKQKDETRNCKIHTITYSVKYGRNSFMESKCEPHAVLFVKYLKQKHLKDSVRHSSMLHNQLIAIVERSSDQENQLKIGLRTPLNIQFWHVPFKDRTFASHRETGHDNNFKPLLDIRIERKNLRLDQPLHLFMLKSKHIKRIQKFKNDEKFKQLLVVLTFNQPIIDAKTDDFKPDIVAVLHYKQKEGVLIDLNYPQGINDYADFRKRINNEGISEQIIINHEALVDSFKYLGYENNCNFSKKDKMHRKLKYMKPYYFFDEKFEVKNLIPKQFVMQTKIYAQTMSQWADHTVLLCDPMHEITDSKFIQGRYQNSFFYGIQKFAQQDNDQDQEIFNKIPKDNKIELNLDENQKQFDKLDIEDQYTKCYRHDLIPNKVSFIEDDKFNEYPCITFKTKKNIIKPEPCFSVFRGQDEILNIPIWSIPVNLKYPDSQNLQRVYQLSASTGIQQQTILLNDFKTEMESFYQNYLVSIWHQKELRFVIIEFQIQWIPKMIENQNSFHVNLRQIGFKDLILSRQKQEELLRYGLFPLIQNGEIIGCQLLMESIKKKDDLVDSELKYQAFEFRSLVKHQQFNYEQKYTFSRYLMDQNAVLVETRLRKIFFRMEADIFDTVEVKFILVQVNRRILNSIPIRYDMFIDFVGFNNLNLLQNNQNYNNFIKQDEQRQFLPSEVLNGNTILENLYDRNNMSNEINKRLVDLFEKTQNQSKKDIEEQVKKLTILNQRNRFGLSIIEMILTDRDQDRIEDMIEQDIILQPKECLQFNIDMKPLVEDLLQNDNILLADSMIQSIQLSPIDQERKYHFLMFLMPFMQKYEITGVELPSFYKFFANYETKQEEDAEQSVKFESKLAYNQVKKFHRNEKILNRLMRSSDVYSDATDSFFISQIEMNQKIGDATRVSIKQKIINSFKNEKQFSEIQFSFIDFQAYTLSNKILKLTSSNHLSELKQITNLDKGMEIFDLVDLCYDLSHLNEEQFEKMDGLRKLIDHLFEYTRIFQIINLLIFIGLYVVPFVIQLSLDIDKKEQGLQQELVNTCNYLCLFTAIYFELIEITQLIDDKFVYFQNLQNLAEQSMFIVNCVYFEFRLQNTKNFLPKKEHLFTKEGERDDMKDALTRSESIKATLLNTIMVIFIFIKINTWLRLFERFSNLYTLVRECIRDIFLFLFYFAYWTIFFSLLFMVIGAAFNQSGDPQEDYVGTSDIMSQIIQVFRNSIGDIGVPQYEYWNSRLDKKDEFWPQLFIYGIWFFFMVNEILMLVILLNFLIAIVSESYLRVTSIQMRLSYVKKAELNQETFLELKMIRLFCPCILKFKRFDSFLIEEEAVELADKDDQTDLIIYTIKTEINGLHKKLDYIIQRLDNPTNNNGTQHKNLTDVVVKSKHEMSPSFVLNDSLENLPVNTIPDDLKDEQRHPIITLGPINVLLKDGNQAKKKNPRMNQNQPENVRVVSVDLDFEATSKPSSFRMNDQVEVINKRQLTSHTSQNI